MKTFIAPFFILVFYSIGVPLLFAKDDAEDIHRAPPIPVKGILFDGTYGMENVGSFLGGLWHFPGAVAQHFSELGSHLKDQKAAKARAIASEPKCFIAKSKDRKSSERMMICTGPKIDCSHMPLSELDPMVVAVMLGTFVPNSNVRMYKIQERNVEEVVLALRSLRFDVKASGQDYVVTRQPKNAPRLPGELQIISGTGSAEGKELNLNALRNERNQPMSPEELANYRKLNSEKIPTCNTASGYCEAPVVYPIYQITPLPELPESGRRRPGGGPYEATEESNSAVVYEDKSITPESPMPTDSSEPLPRP